MHVTLRLEKRVGNLRHARQFAVVKKVFKTVLERSELRLVHYSVQSNHLHLIIESQSKEMLSKAMKILGGRLSKALNELSGAKGSVFTERYHSHLLTSPRQVKNALRYVLFNYHKHCKQLGMRLPKGFFDPCSSASLFKGWSRKTKVNVSGLYKPLSLDGGTSWLLKTGWWQKHGLLTPTYQD